MARTLRLRASVLLASALAFGMLAIGVESARAATTWYVNSTTGNDLNDCMSPATACQTIQAAINKASNGDTIIVAAGTYPELAAGPLTVHRTLTLLGEQDGVDARTRVGPESIIADIQGTFVTANDVVIDGFTVQNSSVSAFTGYGIAMGAGTTGTQVLNNIIQDNIVGIGLANAGGSQVLIRHNLIRNNNRPGGASGAGIYTDQFVCGTPCSNFLIDENDFKNNNVEGIDVSNTGASPVTNLEVSENDFDMNGRAIFLINTDMSSFHDNSVTGSSFVLSADVRIFGGVDNFTILNNDLSQGVGHAIRLTATIGGANSGVEIHQNNIESYGLTGLTVEPSSHTGTVDAECNWWNSPTGPTNPGNPGGTGEEVVGDADFTPWLIGRAPGGPCIGGEPSTPGKVTGGGQVQGDPLFSPLGELISLPALVPNLSGGGGQSSFGFVARCCPESGNLSYHDHGEDVRIKALTVDSLVISSPGETCPTTPGSKRAVFQGEAMVTRSTGTTEEDYFVDVDDCGEPGNNDAFGIETETHSQPKSKLIGGNIKVH